MKKKFNFGLKIGKNKIKLLSGFTLIELLVVIAIIGILSAIVLVSLDSARARSKDKAVLSQLANMKLQAEIYYDLNNNSYSDLCDASANERGFGGFLGPGLLIDTKNATAFLSFGPITHIESLGNWRQVTCHSNQSGWAVEAPTSKSTNGNPRMYCVDSKKMVEEHLNNLGANDVICGN
jgi:prepilin-type N-terminal cleavage/methylation domain-containing protein